MNWKHASRAMSLVAAGIGALAFAGWVFEIEALKRIHPALVAMKANTALCIMLSGFAIALLNDENEKGFSRRVAQVCALIVAAVGFITLGEHLGWWSSWLDQALFAESLQSAGRSFPGRMNPASAINFMLLGTAVLLLDMRPRAAVRPAQVCALAVIALTYLIFLTYFYDVELPPGLANYLSIALHTVVAFLLLAAGILHARPERGFMAILLADNIGGAIARRMLPAAFFLPALIGWLCVLGRNSGLYGRGAGVAILAASLTLIFTGLVWWSANALAAADTRQRAAEAEQRHLASIVDSSADAIVSKNLQSLVLSWNRGAEQLFGYTAGEMIGQSITRIIPPERLGEEAEILARIRAGTPIEHFETIRIAKDGRAVDVSLSISPVRDERGVIVGASKIVRDITARRQAEAALAQAHAEAEAANRAKDDFLAVLSHELRTPLTPALMAVSDLEIAPPPDSAALGEALALIRRNIELEARLVDDLLDLTRISHGKLRIASAPVDLHATLRDALAIAGPLLRERKIAVSSEFAASRFLVRGDAARLTQIFANLLTNAAKFTPEAGRVTVRTTDESGALRIEIADTGIGIAPELLPGIFEAFRQGEPGTTRRYGGLGLGLNVAKGLVEAHGGTITAQSAGHDCGSTFAVTLPTLEEAAPAADPSSPAVPETPLRPLRIFIVEDHEDTRTILARLIARAGHTVSAVGTVQEARETLAREDFDLVLTDLGLPDGTGVDVIAALRERSAIPAVVMSGYGMESDLERTRAAGFAEHIVKPIAAGSLRELLIRHSARLGPPDRPEDRA